MRSIIGYGLSVLLLLVGASSALADCPKYNTLPRAREGAIGYDKTEKCLFLCDGTTWQTQCQATTPTASNPPICNPNGSSDAFKVCFEAEDPAHTGVSSIVNTTSPPGGKMRSSFGNELEYLDFAPFTVPQTGYYTLEMYYASAEDPTAGIIPNGGTKQSLYLGTSYIQNNGTSWTTVAKKNINIPLNQGSNNLRIAGTNSGGAYSLDKICIRNATSVDDEVACYDDTPLPQPGTTNVPGNIRCWGGNYWGEGNSRTGPFKAINATYGLTCGVRTNGNAECWGYESAGSFTGPFSTISARGYFGNVCAIKDNGEITCWGSDTRSLPGPYVGISSSGAHVCALKSNGDVECWGQNDRGQAPASRRGPYRAVTVGIYHSCAIKPNGDADCWGNNGDGEAPPTGVTGPFVAISGGGALQGTSPGFTCALKVNGDVQCWGNNSNGQAPPAGVPGPFTAISAGARHACGLKQDGSLYCWGSNDYGQRTTAAGPFNAIAAGNMHTCAIK